MKKNRKFWLKLIILQLTIYLLCSCAAKIGKEERISEVNNSVFCLSISVPDKTTTKKRAIGTGFLISENLLATAFHVKNDFDIVAARYDSQKTQVVAWKKFDNGEYIEIPIELAEIDKDSDIAIYRFDAEILKQQSKTRQIKPLILADRLPIIGEDILSIGYYGTMEFPFNSLGNVSNIENGEDIYSDMTLMPGNSGSPLVSLNTGEVLGMNIKVMTMGDGTIRLGISKKSAKLKSLIEKVKKN